MQDNRQDYIFGYGSLIEKESRLRTTPGTDFAIPVSVAGIARGWWLRGTAVGFNTTFLGAELLEGATTNGVIYKVSHGGLLDTDKRESDYKRVKFNPKDITRLDGSSEMPDGDYWVYTLKKEIELPAADFPIVQSYVDICLKGCLDMQETYPGAAGFAEKFITTTQDWSDFWENDRAFPRRPFQTPRAREIDKLLHTAFAKRFMQIRLPGGQKAQL